MKLYIDYFRLRILMFMQYRTAAIAGLTTQFFWGMMLIFIYIAFYTYGSEVDSISLSQIVTYTWLHQSFYALLSVRLSDEEIADSISSGNVAYEIIRPYNLYFWWYIKVFAKRVAAGVLRILPVVILAFMLPEPYGLSLPSSIPNFILFLVSVVLGIFIVTGINMLVYTIGFYTYNQNGISQIINSLIEVLSGAYLPVVLLPMFIQKATYFLPFRMITDLPFRLYSNNIGINEGLISILLQVMWVIILIVLGNLIVKKALKKVFVQGG